MATQQARRWLESAYGPGNAEQIIVRLAEALLSDSNLEYHDNGYVVSAALLLNCADRAGIKQFASPRLKQNAYLTPCAEGFRLSLRISKTPSDRYESALRLELERNPAKRWMFAHELGHTFFYDRSGDPPRKTFGWDDDTEERLCQQFAAELLLPRSHLTRSGRGSSDTTVESLVTKARQYGAPLKAVVRRLVHDLGLLRATCVIISEDVAQSWGKRIRSRRPLPKNGVEFFSHADVTHTVTEGELLDNAVVQRVCETGCYWNSAECDDSETKRHFVEGLRLQGVAPSNARLFLFHNQRPRFTERPLFDLTNV